MNAHAEGVTFALNEMADLTPNERREKNGLLVPEEIVEGRRHLDNSTADEVRNLQSAGKSLNWGLTNKMVGVKN